MIELPALVPFGEMVAEQIGRIGGTVNLNRTKPAGAATEANRLTSRSTSSCRTSSIPDDVAAFLVHGTFGLASFFSHYQNPRIDAFIEEAATTADPEQRTDIYRQVQAILTEDAPVILFDYAGGQTAMRSFMHDLDILPTGMMRLTDTWRDDA